MTGYTQKINNCVGEVGIGLYGKKARILLLLASKCFDYVGWDEEESLSSEIEIYRCPADIHLMQDHQFFLKSKSGLKKPKFAKGRSEERIFNAMFSSRCIQDFITYPNGEIGFVIRLHNWRYENWQRNMFKRVENRIIVNLDIYFSLVKAVLNCFKRNNIGNAKLNDEFTLVFQPKFYVTSEEPSMTFKINDQEVEEHTLKWKDISIMVDWLGRSAKTFKKERKVWILDETGKYSIEEYEDVIGKPEADQFKICANELIRNERTNFFKEKIEKAFGRVNEYLTKCKEMQKELEAKPL